MKVFVRNLKFERLLVNISRNGMESGNNILRPDQAATCLHLKRFSVKVEMNHVILIVFVFIGKNGKPRPVF